MKRRDLLELENIGITDEIRDLAFEDRGEEKMRKWYYGEEIYTAYKIHSGISDSCSSILCCDSAKYQYRKCSYSGA